MERIILRVEKFLAMIFAAFFIVASVAVFGYGLIEASGAFFGASRSVEPLLNAIALVAVAVAVLELGGTILAEEVTRTNAQREAGDIRRTLSRFLYIVITALAIEALVMVFKFSLGDQASDLIYAAAIITATAILLASIAIYSRLSLTVEVEEAENPAVSQDTVPATNAPPNR